MPGQGHQTSQLPVHGSSPGCGSADNWDGAGRSPGWKHRLFASVAVAGSSDGQELRQEGFDFICQDGVCWKETGGGWAGELRWGHPGGDRGHSARARLQEQPWGQELWLLSGMPGPGAQHTARVDAGPKAAALVPAGHGDNVQDGGHPFLALAMWLVARGALGWGVWLPGTALLRGMLLGAGGQELPGAPSSCALRCDLTRAVL